MVVIMILGGSSGRSSTQLFNMIFFLLTEPATTEIYTLSLHDALPICEIGEQFADGRACGVDRVLFIRVRINRTDRKSTRLNSSHTVISYAVFCLKKKKAAQAHNRGTSQTFRFCLGLCDFRHSA